MSSSSKRNPPKKPTNSVQDDWGAAARQWVEAQSIYGYVPPPQYPYGPPPTVPMIPSNFPQVMPPPIRTPNVMYPPVSPATLYPPTIPPSPIPFSPYPSTLPTGYPGNLSSYPVTSPPPQSQGSNEKPLPTWLKDALMKKKDDKAPSSGLSAYDTPFYKGAAHLDKLHPPSLEEEKPAKPEHEDPAEEARRVEELLQQEIKHTLTEVLLDVTNEMLEKIAKQIWKEESKQRSTRAEEKPAKVTTFGNVSETGLVSYDEDSDTEPNERTKRGRSHSPSPSASPQHKRNTRL